MAPAGSVSRLSELEIDELVASAETAWAIDPCRFRMEIRSSCNGNRVAAGYVGILIDHFTQRLIDAPAVEGRSRGWAPWVSQEGLAHRADHHWTFEELARLWRAAISPRGAAHALKLIGDMASLCEHLSGPCQACWAVVDQLPISSILLVPSPIADAIITSRFPEQCVSLPVDHQIAARGVRTKPGYFARLVIEEAFLTIARDRTALDWMIWNAAITDARMKRAPDLSGVMVLILATCRSAEKELLFGRCGNAVVFRDSLAMMIREHSSPIANTWLAELDMMMSGAHAHELGRWDFMWLEEQLQDPARRFILQFTQASVTANDVEARGLFERAAIAALAAPLGEFERLCLVHHVIRASSSMMAKKRLAGDRVARACVDAFKEARPFYEQLASPQALAHATTFVDRLASLLAN